jgi:cell wall-associated NlpC family hydrolase
MNNENICIPSGSKIPASTGVHGHFTINNHKYTVSVNFNNNKSSDLRKTIIESALSMLNTPYLWGGRTSWGTDCSGLSQFLYSIAGIQIPRDASQQVNKGNTLSFISEAQPGDLAFFDNEEGVITHVGIIFDHGKIIHASGKIKIDTIDHQGIYNKTLKKYTHNLRVIKSIL